MRSQPYLSSDCPCCPPSAICSAQQEHSGAILVQTLHNSDFDLGLLGAGITQYPPWEWYQHGPTLAIDKQCQGGTNAYKACINDVDCGGGICAMPQISARDYMKNYMSCCRHCTWDMLYPAAAPIQVLSCAQSQQVGAGR